MKLVIYGMPGVGKLTTAKALATLTGLRPFHNHLSFLFRLSGRELTDGADAGVVEGMYPWQT